MQPKKPDALPLFSLSTKETIITCKGFPTQGKLEKNIQAGLSSYFPHLNPENVK